MYCLERGFESTEDHPGGLEKDEYDEYSLHFLAIDDDQNAAGTARLILPSELGFPAEKHCRFSVDVSRIPRNAIAEISRLAISRMYRRRVLDGLYGESELYTGGKVLGDRRRCNVILLGLLKLLYRESKWRGITHWYAVMEEGLAGLLGHYGFHFVQIGERVDYHGIRAPYLARIADIERQVALTRPEVFRFFTDWERGAVLCA